MLARTDEQPVEGTSDEIKPWTIKGITPEARNAAIAAAGREGLTLGDWFSRNIPHMVKADRDRTRMPATVGPQPVGPRLDDIQRMVSMASELATATQKPLPRSISRPAFKLLRDQLTAASASSDAQ